MPKRTWVNKNEAILVLQRGGYYTSGSRRLTELFHADGEFAGDLRYSTERAVVGSIGGHSALVSKRLGPSFFEYRLKSGVST